MGACRYVGRVGGLAVALGIGIAVANGAGVAAADEEGPASTEASSESAQADEADGTGSRAVPSGVQADDDDPDDEGSSERTHADKRGRDRAGDADNDVAAALDDADTEADETTSVKITPPDRHLPKPADPVTPVDSPLEMALMGAGSRTRPQEVPAGGSGAPASTSSTDFSPARSAAAEQQATASQVTVDREIRRSGIPSMQTLTTADGTRALVTTSTRGLLTGGTTRVAVFDTTTGRQIGSGLTLSGGPFWTSAPLSADGAHALVTTQGTGWLTGKRTQAAVIDVRAGRRVGAVVTLRGVSQGFPVLSADRSRALITATDSTAGGNNRRFAVMNLVTGTQTGTTFTIADDQASATPVMSANGLRVLFIADSYDEAAQTTSTKVTVVDTTTGNHATVSVAGSYQQAWDFSPFNTDGTRALVTTVSTDAETNVHTARLAVINTDSVTSTIVSVVDDQPPSITLSANRSRALIARQVVDAVTGLHETEVTVIDGASGGQVGETFTLRGDHPAELAFSPDGTRAVVSTRFFDAVEGPTSQITLLNPVNGTQVHDPLTFEGDLPASAVFSPDGARALITRYGGEAGGLQVAVVSMSTGAQIGATLDLEGQQVADWVFSPDSTRVVLLFNGINGTAVSVLNAVTGTQVGSAVPLQGAPYPESTSFTTDGDRVVVTTTSGGGFYNATRVAVIDTNAGAQVGEALLVSGTPASGPARVTAGGTRAFIATNEFEYDPPRSTYVTRVAVVDTATGLQVGTTLAQNGDNLGSTALSADGTRAVINLTVKGFLSPATLVAVFDTATGEQIGSTLTRTGRPYAAPVIDADGKRALITTYASGAARIAVLDIA